MRALTFILSIFILTTSTQAANHGEVYLLNKSLYVFNRYHKKVKRVKVKSDQNIYIKVIKTSNSKEYYAVQILDENGKPKYGGKTYYVYRKVLHQKMYASLVRSPKLVDKLINKNLNPPKENNCWHCSEEDTISSKIKVVTSDIPKECDITGVNRQWKKNCKELLGNSRLRKGLPQEALKYALKVLQKNATSFKSNKCYMYPNKKPLHYSMAGLTKKKFVNSYMKNGIKNKCQIIINNLDERYKISTSRGKRPCQMASYYIDLCGDSPKVVKDKAYVGYGTCKRNRGFKNKAGQGTTVVGAFVTGKLFNFSKNDSSYRVIRRKSGGKIPAAALFGLNHTNNRSAVDLKYLHVGAYTSAGCPSMPPNNASRIKKIAKSGPSLLVNYKKGKMEDINKCSRK